MKLTKKEVDGNVVYVDADSKIIAQAKPILSGIPVVDFKGVVKEAEQRFPMFGNTEGNAMKIEMNLIQERTRRDFIAGRESMFSQEDMVAWGEFLIRNHKDIDLWNETLDDYAFTDWQHSQYTDITIEGEVNGNYFIIKP